MNCEGALSQLHFEVIHGLLNQGACPSNAELARLMHLAPADVEQLFRSLSEIHGVVLHPHVCEPWVVHPFSITPTLNWVEGRRRGWWAPCVWCAFGVATLAGGEVQIYTRLGGESEPLTIPVMDGQPLAFEDVLVHFAIPPARAWDNVHQHCAMVLPFRSEDDIEKWCSRHHLPHGLAVPLPQVVLLARRWYGCHANRDWRKWTVAEAQNIFHEAGLTSEFWSLASRSGKF
jgi:hypothetical protein